jgi:hypothetical protein
VAKQKPAVTFVNGFSSRKDVLGVISVPDTHLTQEICRVFFFGNGQWGHFPQDFEIEGKSLTFLGAPEKAWWLLGKNGEVIQLAGSTVSAEQIPEAGLRARDPYGYVNTIKNIDGELYVCGYGRQVYRRRAGAWTSIADDILTQETSRGFFDIDGADKEHIYAVGWFGEIFFYDGGQWHRDDSPTNVHLASVRCVSKDNVWIAGNQGMVLHGRFGQWDVIQNEDIAGNWYSVEEFNGTVYLAGNALLGYVDGNTTALLDVGLGRPVTTYRLRSKDGILWSIGEKHVLRFDGSSWTEVRHPDNMP